MRVLTESYPSAANQPPTTTVLLSYANFTNVRLDNPPLPHLPSPTYSSSPHHTHFQPLSRAHYQPQPRTGYDYDYYTHTRDHHLRFIRTRQHPRFMYANGEIIRRNHAVGIDDVRELVLHLVADAPLPTWLRIENSQMIEKVVVLLVPGITSDLLSLSPVPASATANPNLPRPIPLLPHAVSGSPSGTEDGERNGESPLGTRIPFFASTFSHACPTRAPGDQTRMHSVLSAFFQCPVSGEERRRREVKRLASEASMNKDPWQYVLQAEQMAENDYPLPPYMSDAFQYTPEWRHTSAPAPSGGEGTLRRRIYAIDCEMCLTEDGKELTRVCVIDYYTEKVVYDQLVKPSKPVTDYLTRWSGITAEALAPVTTTFEEVQAYVMKLLSPPAPNPFSIPSSSSSTTFEPPAFPTGGQTTTTTTTTAAAASKPSSSSHSPPILLGHSLESDLKALKISHPFCIDTALLYHHPRGRPLKPGLAWLTRKWCGREIQNRGEGGHDSEEDARACIELVKKKLEMGPGFGEFKVDQESIFERMGRSARRMGTSGSGVRSAVVDYGNPQMMHGSKATTAIGCTSDADVLKGLLDVLPSHQFAFGRFMSLADVLGWTTPKPSPDVPIPEPAHPPTREKLVQTLCALDEHLVTLHAALPPRTAFVILSGHSDPRRMAVLNVRKTAFETGIRQGKSQEEMAAGPGGGKWSAADGRELEEVVELTKRGLLFLGIKQ